MSQPQAATLDRLHGLFRSVRATTLELTRDLSAEDQQIQSMPDVSPTKWHLAHTSWFFETFVLETLPDYRPPLPTYRALYNSYYRQVGERHPRPERGLVSRPSLQEIHDYRRHVDGTVERAFTEGRITGALARLVELGLRHEQQHQELLLMDIQHVLSRNPLGPSYRTEPPPPRTDLRPASWQAFDGGLVEIGHHGDGFSFDNERPRHRVWLEGFELANRPVSNADWLAFVEDGSYETDTLWLDDAWSHMERNPEDRHPLYWRRGEHGWEQFTLHGWEELRLEDPAVHVSYYEADAFAQWAGARLPTEAEWEHAAAGAAIEGNFLSRGAWYPRGASDEDGMTQLFGDVWEWTGSPYVPYPRYQAPEGAVGEYNGKFMCNQYVLRGGSFATSDDHVRPSYRNFFHPHTRWHFAGVRLARDPGTA